MAADGSDSINPGWADHSRGDLFIAEQRRPHPPDLLAVSAAHTERYPFLLESSAGAAAQSRFDVLLAFPGDAIELDSDAPEAFDFFDALDAAAACEHANAVAGLPFIGGWFLYLGYEMAGQVEPTLTLPRPGESALPLALAVRCPAAIIYDRDTSLLRLIAEDNDHDRVRAMLADLAAAEARSLPAGPIRTDLTEDAPGAYLAQVETAKKLIAAGDIFQANLSRAWRGALYHDTQPARLYSALRRVNPAPFSGLMHWRGAAVASSSPERLLSIDAGVAQVRPIAGTRARGTGADDEATKAMLAHPKERAEHVMLIDLERNDLGRVCEQGSIEVDELMVAESYAHVHHIVSNVRGILRTGIGPGAALRAVFPGGTITGCPKVRCMQIIADLEGVGRGAYTGSFGYLSRCGRMDSNILIRSITQIGQRIVVRAGAGIVADSVAENELEETRAKARGVLRSFLLEGSTCG